MSALDLLRGINDSAAYNRWAGFEVTAAGEGNAEIRLAWKPELGQYAGFLHAGLTGALIDTVCGFAAATVVGRVLASHYSVNCLRPAVGEAFVARGRVVRAGKRQVFTAADLFAVKDGKETLVATGETILMTEA
ncbi:MAG: PaaI family thioesterase [Ferrovibrionaceae bacterium]